MSKPPSFQFYAQDFLTGVVYLTNEEVGIYIKMLCKQWTDGKIPKKRLGLLVGYEWDMLSIELKSKFNEAGGYLINERLEKERLKRDKFHKKQRENGSLGGRPKKNPTVNPNETQKKPLEYEVEKEVFKGKGVKGGKPEWQDFLLYALTKKPNVNQDTLKLKYEAWKENDWKTGGDKPRKIKNWKTTLLNTLPHIPEVSKSDENDKKTKFIKDRYGIN